MWKTYYCCMHCHFRRKNERKKVENVNAEAIFTELETVASQNDHGREFIDKSTYYSSEQVLEETCNTQVASATEKGHCDVQPENQETDVLNYSAEEDTPSTDNENQVFCPNCDTEVSPIKKGIQEDQTKKIIAKVYHYFEQEYEELKKMYGDLDLTPLSDFRKRTVLATGVSETTVLQILQEEEGQEQPKKQRKGQKRSRQTDSSSEGDNSDDDQDLVPLAAFATTSPESRETVTVKVETNEEYNEEPEVYIPAAVKVEPLETYVKTEQAHTDPISLDVKTEPRTDVVDTVSARVPDIADGVSESTKASTTEVQTITSRKRKKTNAQKCREYRVRKKLQNTMVQNITAERSDECRETGQLPAKKPKTDAERRKKYYEAQKLKKQASKKSKKIPKTAKQRNKEYYYRKKQKILALKTLNHHSDAANETRALNEPAAATKRKARKTPRRSDVTSAWQHTQGEPSTAVASRSGPPTAELNESGLLGDTEIKVEEIEIHEEGIS